MSSGKTVSTLIMTQWTVATSTKAAATAKKTRMAHARIRKAVLSEARRGGTRR